MGLQLFYEEQLYHIGCRPRGGQEGEAAEGRKRRFPEAHEGGPAGIAVQGQEHALKMKSEAQGLKDRNMAKKRGSGILLHITSLPSPFGVGDLGPSAYRFADFLADTRQSYWQILPLNPTLPVYGNSPYSSTSTFAGKYVPHKPGNARNGRLHIRERVRAETGLSGRQVRLRGGRGVQRAPSRRSLRRLFEVRPRLGWVYAVLRRPGALAGYLRALHRYQRPHGRTLVLRLAARACATASRRRWPPRARNRRPP